LCKNIRELPISSLYMMAKKSPLQKSRQFTNVLAQWTKMYLLIPGENNCSCAMESEPD
jgi:hypothetical protein